MAHDTFFARHIARIYCRGSAHKYTTKTGEAGIKPGDAIRLGTDGLAYLAKLSDTRCAGICECNDSQDMDTAFALGADISFYPRGQDTTVWAKIAPRSPAVAIYGGDPLVLSATDGQFDDFETTYYTNGAIATDTLVYKVATVDADEYYAGSTTNMRIMKINLAGG